MLWIFAFTALAFCGIAVLGVLGVLVYRETGRLARRIEEGCEAFGAGAERFHAAAGPLAARTGELSRR